MTKRFFSLLFRFQLSAIIATMVDFSFTIFLKEACGLGYLLSASIGAMLGGITNFILGRRWVFRAPGPRHQQIFRYCVIWGGSILLNIGAVFILTGSLHFNYIISKIIAAFMIGLTFNYNMQRRFVFVINQPAKKIRTQYAAEKDISV
jgi:putative flippase GtrA